MSQPLPLKAPAGQVSRPVLIFRNEVLPSSETFIRAQALALTGFDAHFVGTHPARKPLLLPREPLLIAPSPSFAGKLRRRLFWRTSLAPGFSTALRELDPALIHAHFALDGAAALPLARRLNVPLIVTLHGYDVTTNDEHLRKSSEGRLYLRRRRQLWDRASLFLCISEFIRDKALAIGFPAARLRVHYTGIDLSLFAPRPVQRDRNLIVFAGRLVEKKGCNRLLTALDWIRRFRPNVHLAVIGSGPMEAALRHRAAAGHLPCTFLGAQPPSVVQEYLAKARLFCVPSLSARNGDSEGLGMVFAEALAMGTPVVSFDHGGIPEVVSNGCTGLLAPEGNTRLLAHNILRLLRDDDLWHTFSVAGISAVREKFDLLKQTAELENIYTAVIQAHATGPHTIPLWNITPPRDIPSLQA